MNRGSLHIAGLGVRLDGRAVLRDVSLSLEPGELVCLLGPNGAGKTTLLRATLGLVARDGGTVRLSGADPADLLPAERARRVAYLPQRRPLAWALSVRDVVSLGRFAYGAAPGRLRAADAAAVDAAIAACELEDLAGRAADTLSGGELSRVHVARAMAAGAPLLFADEPIAALDPLHQFQVMSLLREHVNAGNAALVVLHDVALAARFSDRLAWLVDGRLVADAPAAESLTEERFDEVYGIQARVTHDGDAWAVTLKGRP